MTDEFNQTAVPNKSDSWPRIRKSLSEFDKQHEARCLMVEQMAVLTGCTVLGQAASGVRIWRSDVAMTYKQSHRCPLNYKTAPAAERWDAHETMGAMDDGEHGTPTSTTYHRMVMLR